MSSIKKLVLKNSFFSMLQMLVNTIILFVLYRVIFQTIGVAELGLWSLIVSLNSLMNFAGLGLPGGIVKFVAEYKAKEKLKECSDLVQTSLISMFILSVLAVVIGYPIFYTIVKSTVLPEQFSLAIDVLQISVLAFFVLMLYNSYISIFDGFNRIYQRNILSMIIRIISFGIHLVLLFKMGVIGLAYAKLIEHVLLLVSAMFVVNGFFRELPLLPLRWNKKHFKEIFSYSLNFQLYAIGSGIIDPITRYIMSIFGGLELVGYYELAQKLLRQVRSIVQAGMQSIFPMVATLNVTNTSKIKSIFVKSTQLIALVVVPIFVVLITSGDFISKIWLGELNQSFVEMLTIIGVAYSIAIFNLPGIFVAFGTGEIRWAQVSNLTTGFIVGALCYFSGKIYGGIGVVFGLSIALVLGNNIVTIAYFVKNKISVHNTFSMHHRVVLLIAILSLSVYIIIPNSNFYVLPIFVISFLVYNVPKALELIKKPL